MVYLVDHNLPNLCPAKKQKPATVVHDYSKPLRTNGKERIRYVQ